MGTLQYWTLEIDPLSCRTISRGHKELNTLVPRWIPKPLTNMRTVWWLDFIVQPNSTATHSLSPSPIRAPFSLPVRVLDASWNVNLIIKRLIMVWKKNEIKTADFFRNESWVVGNCSVHRTDSTRDTPECLCVFECVWGLIYLLLVIVCSVQLPARTNWKQIMYASLRRSGISVLWFQENYAMRVINDI